MAQPWKTLEKVATREGSLELRQRGPADFLITVGGRVLMTSQAHRSEDVLAKLACRAVADRPKPKVLIGGLGMGYTLKAALDELPKTASVLVAELNPKVVEWCKGPLSALTDGALADKRVKIEIVDVAKAIRTATDYDAIVLDLYEGPHQATQRREDPLYGPSAISNSRAALKAGGVFAVWSEEPDQAFESRLAAGGFTVEKRKVTGGRAHVVYIATVPPTKTTKPR